jgi:NTP pyrophosphatase (non-canonical NTP hydrolase)
MGDSKEAALKPLEEAAETFGAWQAIKECVDRKLTMCRLNAYPNIPQRDCQLHVDLADEIADCIQACVNLAYREGVDLQAAIERCEKRNRARGRCE